MNLEKFIFYDYKRTLAFFSRKRWHKTLQEISEKKSENLRNIFVSRYNKKKKKKKKVVFL